MNLNTVINTDKVLGRGMNGTIYLVKDKNNNKYAMKIQHIMPSNIEKSLKHQTWRENEFALVMNKKYPKQFMKLYDYKIDNKCNHKQSWEGFPFKMKDLSKAEQLYYTKLFASPYCFIKLWSLIDLTIHDLLNSWKSFNSKMYYDILIQSINIIYLINKDGYFHNDFHTRNIGLVKTKDKYINILGSKIETHGYIVQALDFELVLHKKYILKSTEKASLKNNNDIYSIIYLWLWDFADLKHYYKNQKIEEYKFIDIPKEDRPLLEIYLDGLNLTKYNKEFLLQILYKIIFYEKYEKIILGNKFEKSIPPRLYVPMNVILYMVKHIYEPENILRYLLKNK